MLTRSYLTHHRNIECNKVHLTDRPPGCALETASDWKGPLHPHLLLTPRPFPRWMPCQTAANMEERLSLHLGLHRGAVSCMAYYVLQWSDQFLALTVVQRTCCSVLESHGATTYQVGTVVSHTYMQPPLPLPLLFELWLLRCSRRLAGLGQVEPGCGPPLVALLRSNAGTENGAR